MSKFNGAIVKITFDYSGNSQSGNANEVDGIETAPTPEGEISDNPLSPKGKSILNMSFKNVASMAVKAAVDVGKQVLDYGLNNVGRTYGSQDKQDKVNYARQLTGEIIGAISNPFSIITNAVNRSLKAQDYLYNRAWDNIALSIKMERAGTNYTASRR